jgi:hypothetical protein
MIAGRSRICYRIRKQKSVKFLFTEGGLFGPDEPRRNSEPGRRLHTISMRASPKKPGPILAQVIKQLKKQKYREGFLDAVVPRWWTPDIEDDAGALAHVKLILARALGLDTKALLKENEVRPVAPSGMQFKRSIDLQTSEPPSPNLAYYSRLVKTIASGMEPSLPIPEDADDMNEQILAESGDRHVSLENIVNYCWSRNIGVVHVDNIPMVRKGLDALVYRYDERYVIIVARKMGIEGAARALFIIAHELGHIAMGHVEENCALIDDPNNDADRQKENEPAADAFALRVLSAGRYNESWAGKAKRADTLAAKAVEYSDIAGVDPGHLLLRLAFEEDAYGLVQGALKLIPCLDCNVHEFINRIARERIQAGPIDKDSRALLDRSLLAA